MSTNITFNGVVYSVPSYGDIGYAQGAGNLSAYLIAIASGSLQQTGGNFTLTSDVNFGPTFGLLASYYASRTANPAQSGIVRLANNSDGISWRNATNTGDLALTVNASNKLAFNGVELESNTLTDSHIFVGNALNESTDVAMSGDVSINNAGVTAIADVVVTGKLITGYVSGAGTVAATDTILQAIQKLNGNDLLKLPLAGGTLTGDLTMDNNKAVILRETTANGTDAVTFKAPASVTTSYTINLPPAQGASGQVMQNDGSGNLTWVANGQGTVGTGAQYQLPYYASAGTTLTAAPNINYNASGDFEILNGKNLQLDGATSGNVQIKGAATTTSYSLTMPSAQAAGNLVNDGSGNLSWAYGSNQYQVYTVGTASGSYSGSLTVFDLPFTYTMDGKSLQVFYNGQQLTYGVDYNENTTSRITTTYSLVTGGKITFRTIQPVISAVAAPVTLLREDYIVGTPSGNYTGSTTVFALVNSYAVGGNAMMVTLDGDVQTKGASADYLETNSTTVTFNNALVVGQRVSFIWANTIGSTGVNSGTASQLAYYAASGGVVSGTGLLTVSGTGLLATRSGATTIEATDSSTSSTVRVRSAGGGGASYIGTVTNHDFEVLANSSSGVTVRASDASAAIRGTSTNDSATAGYVGQYVESTVSNVNATGTGNYFDVTSISLTAGDWDVTAMVGAWENNGGTWTGASIGISTTSGNSGTGLVSGLSETGGSWASSSATPQGVSMTVMPVRFSLSATTTIYMKGRATYSAGTPRIAGAALRARRVR